MREVLSARSMNFPTCENHQPSLWMSVASLKPISCNELLLICWKNSLGLSFQAFRACGVLTNQYRRFKSSQNSMVIWSRTIRAFSRAWQMEDTMELEFSI